MAFPHPLDPPQVHGLAAQLGRMLAEGRVERAAALETLWAAARTYYRAWPRLVVPDPWGLRLRLGWSLDDAAAHWAVERAMALIECRAAAWRAVKRDAGAEEVFRAAQDANEKRSSAMDPAELTLAVEEILLGITERAARARSPSRRLGTGSRRYG